MNETTMSSNNNNDYAPKEFLKQFISRDPHARYILDSERDASQSEICRQGKGRDKECMILQMTSRELFTAMQVRCSRLLNFVAPLLVQLMCCCDCGVVALRYFLFGHHRVDNNGRLGEWFLLCAAHGSDSDIHRVQPDP